MPRKARKKSSMNIYHVILRGINQQIIFEDKHDHVQFTLHAGLERVPGVYPWSSYKAYVVTDASFIDVDRVLELFSSHRECMDYLNTDSDEKCMEHVSSYRMSDRAALDVIREQTPCISPSDFQHLELYTRNQYLKMLHHAGISKRQLSRLTGISRTVIDKAVRGV